MKLIITGVLNFLLAVSVVAMSRTPNKVMMDDTILLKVSDVYIISMEANPTTGYIWQVGKGSQHGVVMAIAHDFVLADKAAKMVGGGGTDTWQFQAIKPGRDEITLSYSRPWERAVAPIKTTKLKFLVEKRAVWDKSKVDRLLSR